jgi:hypothetical protein
MHKSLRIIALLVAGTFCSCAYSDGYQAQWLNQFVAPARSYYSSSSRSRPSTRTRIARVHSHRHQPDSVRTVELTPPTADGAIDRVTPLPALVAKPQVTLTLAGDSRDREHAQALLRKTDTTLLEASRRPLNDVQRESYERASQLAGRARRALATNDDAAASSLAVKAWALSADMSGR